MLKRKINQATYDALADVLKAEYKQNGSDYVLDTDDARELIAARDSEKTRADNLKTQLDMANTENTRLKDANGDFTSLETSYKQQLEAKDRTIADLNTTITAERREIHLGAAADKIAAKFTVPSLVKPEILKRLALDNGDQKTVRVLDASGKVSALTMEQLEKEFLDNKEYASIVVANRASGSAGKSGASGTNTPQNPFTPPVDGDGKPKLLANMSPAEIAAHNKAKREAAAAENGNAGT